MCDEIDLTYADAGEYTSPFGSSPAIKKQSSKRALGGGKLLTKMSRRSRAFLGNGGNGNGNGGGGGSAALSVHRSASSSRGCGSSLTSDTSSTGGDADDEERREDDEHNTGEDDYEETAAYEDGSTVSNPIYHDRNHEATTTVTTTTKTTTTTTAEGSDENGTKHACNDTDSSDSFVGRVGSVSTKMYSGGATASASESDMERRDPPSPLATSKLARISNDDMRGQSKSFEINGGVGDVVVVDDDEGFVSDRNTDDANADAESSTTIPNEEQLLEDVRMQLDENRPRSHRLFRRRNRRKTGDEETEEEELRRRAGRVKELVEGAAARTWRETNKEGLRKGGRKALGGESCTGDGNDDCDEWNSSGSFCKRTGGGTSFFETFMVRFSRHDEVEAMTNVQRIVMLVAADDERRRFRPELEGSRLGGGERDESSGAVLSAADTDVGGANEGAQQEQGMSLFEVLFELKFVDLLADVLTGAALKSGAEKSGKGDRGGNIGGGGDDNKGVCEKTIFLPPPDLARQFLRGISHLLRNVKSPSSLFLLLSNRKLHGLVSLPIELYSIAIDSDITQPMSQRALELGAALLRRKSSFNGNNAGHATFSSPGEDLEDLNAAFVAFLKSLAIHVQADTARFFLKKDRLDDVGGVKPSNVDDSESFPLYTRALQLFSSCPVSGGLDDEFDGNASGNAGALVRMSAADVCLVLVTQVAVSARSIAARTVGREEEHEGVVGIDDVDRGSLNLSRTERLGLVRFAAGPSSSSYLVSPVTARLVRLCEALEDGIRRIDILSPPYFKGKRPDKVIASNMLAMHEEMSTVSLISPSASGTEEMESTQTNKGDKNHASALRNCDVSGSKVAVKCAEEAVEKAIFERERLEREKKLHENECRKAVGAIKQIISKMEAELLLLDNILKAGITSLNERAIELFLQTYVHRLLPQMLSVPIEAGVEDEPLTDSFLSSLSEGRTKTFLPATAFLSMSITDFLLPPRLRAKQRLNFSCKNRELDFDDDTSTANGEEGLDLAPAKASLLGLTTVFMTIKNRILLHLLLTAVFHSDMPSRNKRRQKGGLKQSNNIGRVLIEDKEEQILRVDDRISPPSCYEFGRKTRFGKAADLALAGDAFLHSAALADVFEGNGRTVTVPNHHRRALIACLTGNGGPSTAPLKPFALLLTQAASKSIEGGDVRAKIALFGSEKKREIEQIPRASYKRFNSTRSIVVGDKMFGASLNPLVQKVAASTKAGHNSGTVRSINSGDGSNIPLETKISDNSRKSADSLSTEISNELDVVQKHINTAGSGFFVPTNVTAKNSFVSECLGVEGNDEPAAISKMSPEIYEREESNQNESLEEVSVSLFGKDDESMSWGADLDLSQVAAPEATKETEDFASCADLGFGMQASFPSESLVSAPSINADWKIEPISEDILPAPAGVTLSDDEWFHFEGSSTFGRTTETAEDCDRGSAVVYTPPTLKQKAHEQGSHECDEKLSLRYPNNSTTEAKRATKSLENEGFYYFSENDDGESDSEDHDMLLCDDSYKKKSSALLKKVSIAHGATSSAKKKSEKLLKKSVKKSIAKLKISSPPPSMTSSFDVNNKSDSDSFDEL